MRATTKGHEAGHVPVGLPVEVVTFAWPTASAKEPSRVAGVAVQ